MGRGFGVSAAVSNDVIESLAREAEQLGYTSFWVNDIPNHDGLESLAAAGAGTTAIKLGVGVIPLDKRPPATIDRDVELQELPLGRLLLGVGSGGGHDALARVRSGVAELQRETSAAVVVGALGPKMAQLAGEVADGVLLNWMTSEYLAQSGELVREAAQQAARPAPSLMAYVRCGLEPGAEQRLDQELAYYDSVSYFQEHLARMGASGRDTCVLAPDSNGLQAGIARFEAVLDETIVRAITPTDDLDDLQELLRACAPDRA
ncbi:MAG TPA: LLM class flavin-dependent oxidoreductase [Ilumatobacter sp.]|nr:LLM class flavin-dependent oxidoreductase [Ilumatobacter sp.]